MVDRTGSFVNTSTTTSQWVGSFHDKFERNGVWESGNPDERGITDQVMLLLRGHIPNIVVRFADPKLEAREGYDIYISFTHQSENMPDPIEYRLYLQAKMFLGRNLASLRVEFTKGRSKGSLQAEKLHGTITRAIASNPVKNTCIGGGYLIYGPAATGVVYVPIRRLKELWGQHYNIYTSSKRIDEAITGAILNNNITQFQTVLTDIPDVPPLSAWLAPGDY